MHIQGAPYHHPSTWNAVASALARSAVAAFESLGLARVMEGSGDLSARHEVGMAWLAELEKFRARLSHREGTDGRLRFELAQDLLLEFLGLAVGADGDGARSPSATTKPAERPHDPAAPRLKHLGTDGGVYWPALVKRLRKVEGRTPSDKLSAALHKSVKEVLADFRNFVSVRSLFRVHGDDVSVNQLDRDLRAVHTEHEACMRVLGAWRSHPDAASLIVGRPLNVDVGDLLIERAIRSGRCPAPWLLNWNLQYGAIQAAIPQPSGSQLSRSAASGLSPPLFVKGKGDVRRVLGLHDIEERLALIAELEGHHTASITDDHALDVLAHDVRADDPNEPLALLAMGLDATAADEVDGSMRMPPGNGDGEGHAASAAAITSLRLPDDESPHEALFEICLARHPPIMQVALMVRLANGIPDAQQRAKFKAELQKSFVNRDVYGNNPGQIDAQPRLSALTDAVLCAHFGVGHPGEVTVPAFQRARETAQQELETCCRNLLKAEQAARQQDSKPRAHTQGVQR